MAWQIDSAHSHIQFSVRHMMISTVRGTFDDFSGTITFDEQNPTNSSVHVEIDASSINTREKDRDTHLRSPDFLEVEQHPTITFQSTRIEKVGRNSGRIYGNLTIRGITREVVLATEFVGKAQSPWGTTSAGFNATTEFDRKAWGLQWNQTLETGGILVGDKIKVDIELQLVQQQEESLAEAELITAD